ncbi:alpha/beta hydrolase [Hoyosella sp. YIM 151337]|uniref:alpha/beta hydrolase n=1 Tax=Hoyosella sp. YIM 151337 TaxID=2992742 RepID=UPI002235D3CA|nr:alpha/beta hydrolase [Hoyosella sp. YIM 151337]MCW4355354.1 alpha/beta hydrolase [Hoyosella sp. YIM 151337]
MITHRVSGPVCPANARNVLRTVTGLLFAGAVALAGCSAPDPAAPDAEPEDGAAEALPDPGGDAPGELDAFYEQNVEWEPCDEYGDDLATSFSLVLLEFSCARVAVPLNYDDPDGEAVYVAIARRAAEGDRLGALVVNPGGPGVGGVQTVADLAAGMIGTDVASRFDIVGLDPRGVGAAVPAVNCRSDAERDAVRAEVRVDMSPEGVAAQEAENERYATECAERTGSDFLATVGTREGARDLDIVRSALGDEQLNFLGYSYATFLGAKYAEAFPGRVRAMILDGAVDPAEDEREALVRQAEGFQRAFDAFAADCANQPECPIGNDPNQSVKEFRSLVDPLIDGAAATTDPRGLSYDDALTGVVQALYVEEYWPTLRTGLRELRDGRGDTLLLLADVYERRGDDGTYDNSDDAFTAVRCVDTPAQRDREQAGETDRLYREAAPFLDDGRGTGLAPLSECAFWPVPHTSEPGRLDVPEDLPTILVVSTTGDPATPYEAGVELADQLGAALLTVEGSTHTAVFQGITCVDDAAAAYLVDGVLPSDGARC